MIYIVFVLIKGNFSNFYLYPFLDMSTLGIGKVLTNSLLLLIVTVIFLVLFYFIGNKSFYYFSKSKMLILYILIFQEGKNLTEVTIQIF